jgi:hypothetical protein
MIFLAQAIYSLYTNAFNIINIDNIDTVEVYDVNNNPINIDKTAVTAKNNELAAQAILDDCKKQASKLLYATDWTTIPDITNTDNDPYLTNQAEFIAYRNEVRKLAVNPVANPTFPTVPTAQWSN